jgi:hypothetical protein
MFPGHERKSTAMVDAIAKRLALPNTTRDYVKLLVEPHGDAISYRNMMTPRAARRFLAKFPNS